MFDAPNTLTAPRRRPQPRGLPRCAQPARCGLAAGSPTSPSRMHFAGLGLLFLFFCKSWRQVLGSGCFARNRMSVHRDPKQKSEGPWGLFSQEPVSCCPRRPLIPLSLPTFGGHPPRTSSGPYIHLQASPNPARKNPPLGLGRCGGGGVTESDVSDPTTSLAFPSSSPGPGTRPQS